MRYEAEIIMPFIFMIIVFIVFSIAVYFVITGDNKEIKLCEDNNLVYLGGFYDENGHYEEYCGELKNSMLVKKYKIINDRYLEDES